MLKGEASWSITNLEFSFIFLFFSPLHYNHLQWGIIGQVSSLKDRHIYNRARLGDPQVIKQSSNSVVGI